MSQTMSINQTLVEYLADKHRGAVCQALNVQGCSNSLQGFLKTLDRSGVVRKHEMPC